MKKIILVVGLAVGTLLALASCGAKNSFTCAVTSDDLNAKIVIEGNGKEFTKLEVTGDDAADAKKGLELGDGIDGLNKSFEDQDKSFDDYFKELTEGIKKEVEC